MKISPIDVARVAQLLPDAAVTDYGWTPDFIREKMEQNNTRVYKTVRLFWLERVNETAEYLDINGKPLTQIHQQAKEMLDYWDAIIKSGKEIVDGKERGGAIAFGRIAGPTEGVCASGN